MGNASRKEIVGTSGKAAENIFDFVVEGPTGEPFDMSTLRGRKAFLIVNTASE